MENGSVIIVIDGIPLPWKAPFVGTRGAFSPRSGIMRIIRQDVKNQYMGPLLDGMIDCSLKFYMPIPKGVSKKKRQEMIDGKIRPNKRPDRTNLAKLYEDCLEEIVIKDDGAIVDGRVSKWYGEVPRTEIYLEIIR